VLLATPGRHTLISRLFKAGSFGRAISESLLIMFGVLAALAVQSWWDDRVERDVLLSHLTAVSDELQEASRSLEKSLQHSGAVIDRTHAVLTILADAQTRGMPESFMTTVGEMYAIRGAGVPISAYDAFANSGSFRLVGDRALRGKLAEYRNAIASLGLATRTLWDVYYEVQAPFLNRHFVISDFDWPIEREDAFGKRIGSSGEVPNGRYAADWQSINTLEFWNLVYDWRIAYGDQISSATRVQGLCKQLTDLLDAEIEKLQR
jgi:hypothetical protein